jgi:hypothetical protein
MDRLIQRSFLPSGFLLLGHFFDKQSRQRFANLRYEKVAKKENGPGQGAIRLTSCP